MFKLLSWKVVLLLHPQTKVCNFGWFALSDLRVVLAMSVAIPLHFLGKLYVWSCNAVGTCLCFDVETALFNKLFNGEEEIYSNIGVSI
eukprot:2894281-Amphidinium_carterae.1